MSTRKICWTLVGFNIGLLILMVLFPYYRSNQLLDFSRFSNAWGKAKTSNNLQPSLMNNQQQAETDSIIALQAQRIDITDETYAWLNLKRLTSIPSNQSDPLLDGLLTVERLALEAHVYPQWIVKTRLVANESITDLVSQNGVYSVEYVPRDAYILHAPYRHAQSVADDPLIKFVSLLPNRLKIEARLLSADNKPHSPLSSGTKNNATHAHYHLIVHLAPTASEPYSFTSSLSESIANRWQTNLQRIFSSPDIRVKGHTPSPILNVTVPQGVQLSPLLDWLSEQPESRFIGSMSKFHIIQAPSS
jgi:hypothetical protein